ncbi:MAG: hypothetical protein LBC02_00260 [Planctomycetaceae bacterium]|nr:hypothetical protein [Planctomycetaceae bacterium]
MGGVNVIHDKEFTLIPYYAWSNRGEGRMKVFFDNHSDCMNASVCYKPFAIQEKDRWLLWYNGVSDASADVLLKIHVRNSEKNTFTGIVEYKLLQPIIGANVMEKGATNETVKETVNGTQQADGYSCCVFCYEIFDK